MSRVNKSTEKPVTVNKEVSRSGIPSKILKNKTAVMQPKSEEVDSRTSESISEEYVLVETEFVIKSKKTDTVTCQEIEIDNREMDAEMEGEDKSIDKENERESEKEKEKEKDKYEEVIQDHAGESNQEDGENESDNCKVQLTEDIITQPSENNDSKEEIEEHEAKLNLTIEDSPLKMNLKEEINGAEERQAIEEELQQQEVLPDVQKENGHAEENREDLNEETIESGTCSVEVVESTTSEVSEASESVQTESDRAISKEVLNQVSNKDLSFVSFDASIMLKDVQVRLNDCLKDNSHLFEVTDEERSMSEPLCRDSSFGRTLRNISGRHSINRMRHVTVRSRLSPNSSLYVNMSSASLPDEDGRDHKILRHKGGLSGTPTCNGTPAERKRKLEPEACREAKKIKTDSESSLLDTSIGILQGLRRPIQVSTPNVGGYKFKADKLDVSEISTNDNKAAVQEQPGIVKKWCSIM